MIKWLNLDSVCEWRKGIIRKCWEYRIVGFGGYLDVRCGGKSKIYIDFLVFGLGSWRMMMFIEMEILEKEKVVWRVIMGREFIIRCLWINRCLLGGWVYGFGFSREI